MADPEPGARGGGVGVGRAEAGTDHDRVDDRFVATGELVDARAAGADVAADVYIEPVGVVAAMPERLARALARRRELAGEGVWFAAIRHHSPACAGAVRDLIRGVGPAAVLIEGPETYAPLLADLVDPATRPPVAILNLAEGAEGTVSSLYPLADFSPEWVGLKEAAALGVPVAFIDAPYRSGDAEGLSRTLQHERYYAHSQTLAALAAQQHCRDHDELWEQLFELRVPGVQGVQPEEPSPLAQVSPLAQPEEPCSALRSSTPSLDSGERASSFSPRPASVSPLAHTPDLFEETFVWSALARLDYEPEVLLSDGSLTREARMAARIEEWRGRGPLVVITGAFHTLALIEALTPGDPAGELVRRQIPVGGYGPAPDPTRSAPNSWLIRYDLTRLDGLRGYGAGIPAPGFYQRVWEAVEAGAEVRAVATECLVDIATAANHAGTSDLISVAEVEAAVAQAQRLAVLRGHAWPGRTDVLDACGSCFVRGETGAAPALRDAVAAVFGGTRLGVVPAATPAPPIVAEARDLARRLRFQVDDSTRRTVTLDLHRSATARRRSRYLALMSYLTTGFASKQAGPDFIAGYGLERLTEEREYAWTPMVEAALIGLADQGTSLREAATTRLRAAEAELVAGSQERSAAGVAGLLAQAAAVGLDAEVTRLATRVGVVLETDPALASVVAAARRLLGLWRAREVLELAAPERIRELVAQSLPQVAYLIDGLVTVPEADEDAAVGWLLEVRDLTRQVAADQTLDLESVQRALIRLRLNLGTPAGIQGGLYGLAATDGDIGDADLSAWVQAGFAPGADLGPTVRRLAGLMRAAPDLLLHTPELFSAVDAAVARLDPAAFLDFLPELRRSFSWLKPFETAALAEKVAARTGSAAALVAAATAYSTADLARGAGLERALLDWLRADELTEWAGAGHAR